MADSGNYTIRKITPNGVVITLAGLAGSPGSGDGVGSVARFSFSYALAVDSAGNIYVADGSNHTIRRITPAGIVTTLAGLAGNSGSTNGTGSAARFARPTGVAVDSAGTVYVADTGNNTIRKITPDGVVTTFAGLAGTIGSTNGTGSAARFSTPTGVAVDSAGNVYVTELRNQTIRKITAAGVVTTLAGSAGSSGSVDGTGSVARFNFDDTSFPSIALDGAGNAYVPDNSTIRKITPAGVVTTLAGLAGSRGSADGIGIVARFKTPYGIGVDGAGNVFVADTYNNAIRIGRPMVAQLPPPSLQITRSSNRVTLSWPASATGFVLESAPNLSPATSWTPITTGITTNVDQAVFLSSPAVGASFFRLRR